MATTTVDNRRMTNKSLYLIIAAIVIIAGIAFFATRHGDRDMTAPAAMSTTTTTEEVNGIAPQEDSDVNTSAPDTSRSEGTTGTVSEPDSTNDSSTSGQ